MNPNAELRAGSLRIRPPIVQAPMSGITHTAFRSLLAELGGVGLYCTEMLSARSLPVEDLDHSPYLARAAAESPLSFQLLVAEPRELEPAVRTLEKLGPDAIDLNLGCPAPEVRRRGAGSSLMECPDKAKTVVALARSLTSVSLTAKIRLGERLDEASLRNFCRMLEGEGVDLLTVHARLRNEPYGRKPRWEWIEKVKSWVSIPVVANGGIFSAEDADKCRRTTGCDGLMLGRGAVTRPWLPAEVARTVYGAQVPARDLSRSAVYRRFATLLAERLAPERQLGRLKEFTRYYSQNYPFGHVLATRVQSSRSVAEALVRADAFFEENESCRAEA